MSDKQCTGFFSLGNMAKLDSMTKTKSECRLRLVLVASGDGGVGELGQPTLSFNSHLCTMELPFNNYASAKCSKRQVPRKCIVPSGKSLSERKRNGTRD